MTAKAAPANSIPPEKTLFDVLRDMWQAKIYMLSFAAIMVVIAFAFITLANPFYRAQMIIAPASPMGQGLSDGVRVHEGTLQAQREDFMSNAAFLRFENIYDGVSVANFLLQDEDIINGLAADRLFEFSEPFSVESAEALSGYLQKRVILEPVSGTPLRRISYMHPNKAFAVELIKRIHRLTDEMIRARILVETTQRIDYLNVALAKTQNPDHRRSIASLLMEQERLKMMVSLDQPYAASIVEPAYVSSKSKWPDPYVIYPAFIFIGFLFGFVIFGLRHHG